MEKKVVKTKDSRNKYKKVNLITGATSMLAIELMKKLLELGEEVRILTKSAPDYTDGWQGIPQGVIPYVVDFTLPTDKDRKNLDDACTGVDRIFHIGGAIYLNKNSFDMFMNINVVGTENILTSAVENNPKNKEVHIIFASSTSVYGHNRKNEILTEDSKTMAETPYGKSKYITEQLIQTFGIAHPNLKYTIMRMGVLYGTGYEKAFCKVFELIKKGEMKYTGNGENHLTLINIKDATEAMVLAATNENSKNKIYNLTDGKKYTQKYLFTLVAKYLNVEPPNKHIPMILAKIGRRTKNINADEIDFLLSDRVISIEKIKRDIKFSPKAKIEVEGLEMAKNCVSR